MTDRIYSTSYPNIFITKKGDAYRLPVKGERMPINENGLVYLKPAYRGHPKYPEKQYECINITLRDENGNYIKQIKKTNHQLVAETFVPNPNNYTEVMHIDGNNRNNDYTNLKWGTHRENMKDVISPCTIPKSYQITEIKTGKVWKGINLSDWVRENIDMLIPRIRSSDKRIRSISRHLTSARSKGHSIWGLIVEF